MTVTTTTNKINAVGDGIQTNFPYNFKVTVATQMLVYLDNILYGAAYTVNGVGNEAGGSVDITVPPGAGVIVTLYRYVPEVQETDYEPYRAFPSETVENDMDLSVMRDQQLQEVDSRAVKAPINDDGSFDYTLPAVAAGKGIKANATGDGWVETTYDPDEAQTDSAANVILTNADVVLTNADVVLTHADVVLTHADVVLTNADVVEAQGWNDLAAEWAENPEDVPISGHPGEYSALHWAAKAEAGVGVGGVNSAPGAGFTSGTIRYYKVGKLVTIVFEDLVFISNPVATSAAGAIPAAYLPANGKSQTNTYKMGVNGSENVTIAATGTLSVVFFDFAGAGFNKTSVPSGSISYLTD